MARDNIKKEFTGTVRIVNSHLVVLFPKEFSTRSAWVGITINSSYVHQRKIETVEGCSALRLPTSAPFKDGDSVHICRVAKRRSRFNIIPAPDNSVSAPIEYNMNA